MPAYRSIAARLEETGGRAAGFDYLRLLLAVSIVAVHSGITSYGSEANIALFSSTGRPLLRLILPAFCTHPARTAVEGLS